MKYQPEPIATSCVHLTTDILDLGELLAKNVHDVWASQRLSEGWRYGPRRDDGTRQHPCLVPYEDLPESEKEFDRRTALETLKVILTMGYRIEKA